MARISGVEPGQTNLVTRVVYWLVKRKVEKLTGMARLVEPVKITAHHPPLLRAVGQMEMGLAGAKLVPDSLKSLASIKAATMIGCPY